MFTEIVGAVVLLLVYWYYRTYVAPKRLRAYYQRTLKNLGYRVYELPYEPFGMPRTVQFLNNVTSHKDILHTVKHLFIEYDVIISNVGTSTHLHMLNPNLTQHLISAEGVMLAPKKTQFFDLLFRLTKNSLVFLEGNQWKHRRRILSSLFSYNALMDMAPLIRQLCDMKFKQEEERAKGRPAEKGKIQLNMQEMAESIFGNVVISFFLGLDSNEEKVDGKPLNIALSELNMLTMKLTFHPLVLMFGSRIINLRFNADCRRFFYVKEQGMRALKKYIRKHIYQFKEKKAKDPTFKAATIIDKVIQDLENEANLEQILAEKIYMFLIAGEENTSNFFVALMFEVFSRPQILLKLKTEIDQHIKCEEDITGENLKKMEYLGMVFEEALRLRSPSIEIFDRCATQNMNIGDIPVLKGTILNTGYKAPMYVKENFQDPLEFKPERWKEERYKSAKMQQIAQMNFSGGPRNCIGKQLVYLEVKIAIVKFLRRYDNLKELKQRIYGFNFTCRFINPQVQVARIDQSQ